MHMQQSERRPKCCGQQGTLPAALLGENAGYSGAD